MITTETIEEKALLKDKIPIKTRLDAMKASANDTPLFLQHSLITYVETLSKALKTSEKVAKHAILKSETWTKSCYDLLSKLITEELTEKMTIDQKMNMGTTLSSKTLQKIVGLNYKLSYPIDPRTLNTLTKVVIFLGYQDWNNFVSSTDQNKAAQQEEKSPEETVKQLVEEAIRREHLAYCNLPKVDEGYLSEVYIKNSPAFNMIMDMIVDKKANQHVISNHYNPSTCEVLDIEVKKIKENYAQVHTKQYWLLCWWDISKEKYVKRYKNISDHYYILNKDEGTWKIKTNASISDLMELEEDQQNQ